MRLADAAGGLGFCRHKANMPKPFADRTDPDCQAILRALCRAHEAAVANPRVDMLPPDGERSGQ